MKSKRIGYLLMIVGILIPLYFLGTMTMNQFLIRSEMKETLSKKTEISGEMEQKINDYKQQNLDNNIKDPFAIAAQSKASDVVGYLVIPKIASVEPLRLGASEANLEIGVSHISGTAMPTSAGRSIIAGHRSRIDNLMFYRINELVAGDKIYLSYNNRIYEYEVTNTKIINATDTNELTTLYPDKNMLSLLTCDPVYPPFNYRLIVDSELKGDVTNINELVTTTKVEYNKLLIFLTAGLLVVLGFVVRKYTRYEMKERKKSVKEEIQ